MPSTDPFTYTAHGARWVVQSWLASVLFRAVEDLGGGNGLRVLMALLTAAIFAVVWRLTRPTQGLLVRTAIGGLVLVISGEQWSQRPLLIGLLALGLTVLAGEDGLDPRWLLPLGWVWVNSHGSFPLGVAYLVVAVVGRRLDHAPSAVEERCLRWLLGGVLLGALNPLGPRLLLFPVELLQKQDVLRHIIEWQAPQFQSLSERAFLVLVVVAVLALVRRPSYRSGLVVAVFVAAALLGSRNIAIATLVLVPVLAGAWSDVGSLRADTAGPAARLATVGALALVVVIAVARLRDPAYDLAQYPLVALDRLRDGGVDLQEVRLVAPDKVGNLLELRDGPRREVFYDDRFDMFPTDVSAMNIDLVDGLPRSLRHLEELHADVVLWPAYLPLSQILTVDDAWRRMSTDDGWVLFCRRGAELGGRLGAC